MPTVECHLITCNDEDILPWTLKHYATFCSRIVVHDAFSCDQTRNIARRFGAQLVDLVDDGDINDRILSHIKDTAWIGTKADWVICVDCDELVYFPGDTRITLARALEQGIAVVKPRGFEMFSESWPKGNGHDQIYDHIKMGAPDDKWYAKPALFTPHLVAEMRYSPGAHSCRYKRKGFDDWLESGTEPNTQDPVYMLHYKHIGPIERIARVYDEKLARLSTTNKVNGWGNFEPGLKHAQDKRNAILSRLMRVVE